jgi:hypothetical protein
MVGLANQCVLNNSGLGNNRCSRNFCTAQRPLSSPPSTPSTLSPPRRLRATFTSPCWLDQHCVRRAQPALQPAMLPAKQLRYDPRTPSALRPAPASFDDSIYSPATSVTGSTIPIDTTADELGDTALCLYLLLRRGSWLFLEEQRPPRWRHHLRCRFRCLVPPPLRRQRRCDDTR